MKQVPTVKIIIKGLQVQTDGLATFGQQDLKAEVSQARLVADCEAFLRYVVTYIVDYDARIHSEETLSYGFWLTKFMARGDDSLEAWEYDARTSDYAPGVTFTVESWRDQHDICREARADFSPPSMNALVVVSEGVLEGDHVEAIRYPSPDHMSGWWITTERYDGNIRSLTTHHLYHLASVRPDLIRYLALPNGFRFATSDSPGVQVWFDEDVANG